MINHIIRIIEKHFNEMLNIYIEVNYKNDSIEVNLKDDVITNGLKKIQDIERNTINLKEKAALNTLRTTSFIKLTNTFKQKILNAPFKHNCLFWGIKKVNFYTDGYFIGAIDLLEDQSSNTDIRNDGVYIWCGKKNDSLHIKNFNTISYKLKIFEDGSVLMEDLFNQPVSYDDSLDSLNTREGFYSINRIDNKIEIIIGETLVKCIQFYGNIYENGLLLDITLIRDYTKKPLFRNCKFNFYPTKKIIYMNQNEIEVIKRNVISLFNQINEIQYKNDPLTVKRKNLLSWILNYREIFIQFEYYTDNPIGSEKIEVYNYLLNRTSIKTVEEALIESFMILEVLKSNLSIEYEIDAVLSDKDNYMNALQDIINRFGKI